ncbi:dihydroorotase [Rhodoplanes azumiensis]|uniref:Dihydroorotase family protein n=1 Tax=Rhodoplanes azumiensis TaxID=1897628 RepID=A0ABW5AGS5_9BRAD
MKTDLVVRNARVVRHDGEFFGGVAVVDGTIAMLGANAMLPDATRVIDAEGRVLMPGVIDTHCHLGFHYPYDEDLATETPPAAVGGVTSALDYTPLVTADHLGFFREKCRQIETRSAIDWGFHFIIQREEDVHRLAQITADTGVTSYKFYFGYEPDNAIGIVPATDGWIFGAMRALVTIPGGVINVHCENTAVGTWLERELRPTGRQDLGAYQESRPGFVEEETIRRMIFFSELTGCPLHVVHTTIGAGVRLGVEARARGVDVTIETCPHYLTRTSYDPDLDMKAKICPPLRTKDEQEALWRGVADGGIFSIGTDHVPFRPKTGVDLWTESPGAVGFQWELPLMLHFGHHARGVPLTRLVEINSFNPARRFGLAPRKGTLQVGADADLVLVDLDLEKTVTHQGKGHCIYEGMRLKGWPVATIVAGAVVAENGAYDDTAARPARCLNVPAGMG